MSQASLHAGTLFGPELAEDGLLAIACELGAANVSGWSDSELSLIDNLPQVDHETVQEFKVAILAGKDPLGDEYCRMRTREVRRELGATYTPPAIV